MRRSLFAILLIFALLGTKPIRGRLPVIRIKPVPTPLPMLVVEK